LTTTPLSIHYFNYFPNYFILANLIACPISVLIIPLGFIILITAQISSVVAGFFGKIMKLTIWFLNESMSFVEQLPLSVWNNLDWSKFEMVIAYFVVGCLLMAVYKHRKSPVWAGLASLILMTGNMFFRCL
jgi:competence protein ComEC